MGFNRIYPLVNVYITNWKIHQFYSWVNPRTFDWAILQFANCNKLPEGMSSWDFMVDAFGKPQRMGSEMPCRYRKKMLPSGYD